MNGVSDWLGFTASVARHAFGRHLVDRQPDHPNASRGAQSARERRPAGGRVLVELGQLERAEGIACYPPAHHYPPG